MDVFKQTAPCGVDCFNCGVHESNVTDEVRAMLRIGHPDLAADAACQGCRTSGCFIAKDCGMRRCVLGRGLDFCFECDEYPCPRLMPAMDKADRYPQNFKLYNLGRIQRLGVARWAEEASDIRQRYFHGTLVIGEGPRLEGEPQHVAPRSQGGQAK